MKGLAWAAAAATILAITSGCVRSRLPAEGTYTGLIAAEVGLAASVSDAPDGPRPGDACPDCGGSGKVGDGVVMVDCQACDGTGRVTEPSEAEPVDEPDSGPLPPKIEPPGPGPDEVGNRQLLGGAKEGAGRPSTARPFRDTRRRRGIFRRLFRRRR